MQRTIVRLITFMALSLGLVAGSLGAVTASGSPARGHGHGLTRVAIAPAVVKLVTSAGIAVSAIGDASLIKYHGTVALKFPITSAAGGGTRIKHSGGVRLRSDSSWVALKRFRINTERGTVSAWFNNAIRVDVFTLAKSHRQGLGKVRLRLTTQAAKALNNFFVAHAFKGGQTFGYATIFAK